MSMESVRLQHRMERFLKNLLLNEKNELHNRDLHIGRLLNGEKVDIEKQKVDIQSVLPKKENDFSVKTTIHMHNLLEKFGYDEVFDRSTVMEKESINSKKSRSLFL